jgi:hypothetical protein
MYLCYLHTAHVLGHRYHGIPASSGCPPFIKVSPTIVEETVKILLEHWQTTTNITRRSP